MSHTDQALVKRTNSSRGRSKSRGKSNDRRDNRAHSCSWKEFECYSYKKRTFKGNCEELAKYLEVEGMHSVGQDEDNNEVLNATTVENNQQDTQDSANLSMGNAWNEEVVLQFFGKEMGDRILEIPRLPYPNMDTVIWKGKQDGNFSVKSAYIVDQDFRFRDNHMVWKWLWNSRLHPRISVLLWRVLNNAIPVKERLPFLVDKECSFCNQHLENCVHIFRDCSMARSLWFSSRFPLRIEQIPGAHMLCFVQNLVQEVEAAGIGKKEILTYLGCIIDQIWLSRNQYNRLGTRVNMSDLRTRVSKAFEEYLNFTPEENEAEES
ncbi:hypothetical protein F8388_024080 [Cannabis sativa]|uniref:Reverse transcriptase zinc-binding domain-containing protein n=1 Tax=Cannabis sativa TaxID=3483 RepID=A0A7J6FXD6_CANSA|nr:hypothetical protein F8388_024080 [Cannabis sativa]